MDRFPPPAEPDGFDARVRTQREAVASAVRAHESPEFKDLWGAYKAELSQATRRKCGYCETYVTVGQDGDVEHFYPKSEIWLLLDDATKRGEEQDWTAKVYGRKRDILCDRGFYWLAYDWSNYLLSCAVCNRKWKLAYFPASEANPKLPPEEASDYTPLLLNPFTGPDPRRHLRFGDMGEVEALDGSAFGRATIDVCGLDRESLRFARMEKAKNAHAWVSQLLREDEASAEFERVAQQIYDAGNPNYVHSGLVKAVFEQNALLPWSRLEEIVERIRAE